MDNENKSGAQTPNNKKNHFAKRKGYFIDPPKSDEAKSNTPIVAASTVDASAGEQSHKNQQNRNRHRPHKNHGNQSAENRRESAVQPQATAEQPTSPATTQESNKNGDQQNRNRHKRNKQRNRQNQNENQQAAVKDKPIDTTEKKEPIQNRPNNKRFEKSDSFNQKPATAAEEKFDSNEYEQIAFPPISAERDISDDLVPQKEEPTVEVIGIRFKSTGKIYYFDPAGNKLRKGEAAIVETARGLEYGDVAMGNAFVRESDTVPPLRPVVRVASAADRDHHKENKEKEDEAFRVCNEKIIAHKLDMKLIDAQYTFDNSKLLFYFTSAGRVDFRDLVKDLASVFKTRIELRQIGIRDEAKLMGGIGMCGRPLCCTLFISDFGQVSIKMAKEQNLSLNSAKISGICGRLMCCLRYEHETYEYEIKRTPPVDSLVSTANGNGIVTEIAPLAGTVKVRLLSSPDAPPKVYKRDEVVMLQKKQNKDANNSDANESK